MKKEMEQEMAKQRRMHCAFKRLFSLLFLLPFPN